MVSREGLMPKNNNVFNMLYDYIIIIMMKIGNEQY
jgi:hypothetical protein